MTNTMQCTVCHNLERQARVGAVQETLEETEPAGWRGCLWGRKGTEETRLEGLEGLEGPP